MAVWRCSCLAPTVMRPVPPSTPRSGCSMLCLKMSPRVLGTLPLTASRLTSRLIGFSMVVETRCPTKLWPRVRRKIFCVSAALVFAASAFAASFASASPGFSAYLSSLKTFFTWRSLSWWSGWGQDKVRSQLATSLVGMAASGSPMIFSSGCCTPPPFSVGCLKTSAVLNTRPTSSTPSRASSLASVATSSRVSSVLPAFFSMSGRISYFS
mmetsp:Transcript_39814/g.89852  ORF Transcript_39814/g.89852 Transcript_39814/m.89852 type:complete len:211 (-) Transcript_39814:760-1392(-)